MAISECCVQTNSQGQELTRHGSDSFPVACYQDDFQIMNVPWHWHAEWEAVRIHSGSCTVAAGQQKRTLHAGEGFFINSGILHGCWDEDATGCVFHSLVFHPRLVGGSLDSAIYQNYVQPVMENRTLEWMSLSPEVPWQQDALDAIEAAWQACSRNEPGYEFNVRSSLSRLTLRLWQNMPHTPYQPTAKNFRDADRIKTMLSFLHAHYGDTVTISQIAAAASIGESECLRCFRSSIGTTPIQYLKQYRIRQAAGLILYSPLSISEIAASCGFQDMSYFTKSFRDAYGCTPTQYRKKECRSD